MSIEKYYYHKGDISYLSERFPSFAQLHNARVKEHSDNQWNDKTTGKTSHDFMIAFFGKSGYGKSSTINAFFGKDVMETSDVEACTRRCNCLDYEISDGHYLSFGDFPGIGESEYKDQEYLKMYGDFMDHVGVIVYIIRADTRDYSIDEKAFSTIFKNKKNNDKVIIAINQCDKIGPITRGSWKEPSEEQMENIKEKINFIKKKFQPRYEVIPYSASTGWNMNALAEEIVKASLDSEKLLLKNPEIIYDRLNTLKKSLHEFDIEERIKRITAEQLGVEEDEITNDKDFVNDLFSDSLDSVELIMAIEDEFELEIMDEDAEFIKNVQDAIDYVKKHYKS